MLWVVNPLRVGCRNGALLLVLAGALSGCGGTPERKRVPELRGERLDLAEHRLEAIGLDWEEFGGGNLGILVRSNWVVCTQEPLPGKRATTVRLVVDRACPGPPYVVGLRLDEAEERLDAAGIPYEVSTWGEGRPRIRHLWRICDQSPLGQQYASFVRLYVARYSCD
jgi:hypothetical protein